MDTLEWLGEPRNFNDLHLRVAKEQDDREYIKTVTDEVQDKVEDCGRTVLFTLIPEPNQPPLNSFSSSHGDLRRGGSAFAHLERVSGG